MGPSRWTETKDQPEVRADATLNGRGKLYPHRGRRVGRKDTERGI